MTWKPHTDGIYAKLSKANAMLSKIRHYVEQKTLNQFTMLYSNHIYILLLWFGNKTLTLQKDYLSYKKSIKVACYIQNEKL